MDFELVAVKYNLHCVQMHGNILQIKVDLVGAIFVNINLQIFL
jgi:hypothetical protein